MKKVAFLESENAACQKWSELLQLPLHKNKNAETLFYLSFIEGKLSLLRNDELDWSPLSIDFLSNQMRVLKKTIGKNQPLGKAMGVKSGDAPRILDLSLGWAKDAFSLVLLGCSVVGVEFNPVIWALVSDAVERAKLDSDLGPLIKDKLTVLRGDAFNVLQEENLSEYEVIYVDPIFEVNPKGSPSTKELQAISELYELLEKKPTSVKSVVKLAHERNFRRFVIKRSRLAPALLEPVSHQIYGKTIRFDVYINKNMTQN
jgi:16S rRNA (guanine1516-N2)-methyltransferase